MHGASLNYDKRLAIKPRAPWDLEGEDTEGHVGGFRPRWSRGSFPGGRGVVWFPGPEGPQSPGWQEDPRGGAGVARYGGLADRRVSVPTGTWGSQCPRQGLQEVNARLGQGPRLLGTVCAGSVAECRPLPTHPGAGVAPSLWGLESFLSSLEIHTMGLN